MAKKGEKAHPNQTKYNHLSNKDRVRASAGKPVGGAMVQPKLPPGVLPPFTPHPGQEEVAISYWDYRYRLLNCGRRFGKALAVTTPIFTTGGFKQLKDIEVGDWVFDETGKSVLVDYVSEVYYNRDCYLVKFDDGSEIVADAEHDWMVESKAYRKNKVRTPHTKLAMQKLTTHQMSQNVLVSRADGKYESNYSIPNAWALKQEQKELPIEPYFLGLWLGDGNNRNVDITAVDQEVISYLYEYAGRLGLQVTKKMADGKTTQYAITNGSVGAWQTRFSLQQELRKLGVLQNKHIPEIYLLGDYNQRLELLKGLVDSDGHLSRGRYVEFTSCNKRLANDVLALVSSLGIKVTLTTGISKLHGIDCGKKYRVCFTAVMSVGKIARKSDCAYSWKSDVERRFVKSITRVKSVPVKCLHVQNESHLFLAGTTLIPTHNTVLAVNEMLSYAYFNPNSLVLYFAPTITQARDIAWRLLKGYTHHYGGAQKMNEARLEITMNAKGGQTSQIWLRGTENYEAARGLGINFLVVDEIAMMRNWDAIWEEVLYSTLADTQGKVLMCSTPKGYNHWYKLWTQGQEGHENHIDGWKSWTFSSWDNPYLAPEEIEIAKKTLTEAAFAQEWGAQFKRFTGLVYADFDRDVHVVNEVNPEKFVYWLAGHDPGFHNPRAFHLTGVDSEGVWYQVEEMYMPGITNPQFKELVLRLLDKYGLNFENLALATMDSAHKSDIAELSDMGLSFVPVSKSSGEVGKSWVRYKVDKFAERIRTGKYFVHKRCQKTIWEFENYQWPKNKDDQNPDESPLKLNDHCLPPNTIVHTLDGNYQIKDLVGKTGYLLSESSPKMFYNVRKTRESARLFTVKTENKKFQATSDHFVLTMRGWIEVDRLTNDDYIRTNEWTDRGTCYFQNKTGIFRYTLLSLWQIFYEYLKRGGETTSQGGVESFLWQIARGEAPPSQRWRQDKQSNKQSCDCISCHTFAETLDKEKVKISCKECGGEGYAQGKRVAWVKGWYRVAQEAWKKYLGREKINGEEVLGLRSKIYDIFSNKGKVLQSNLWQEGYERVQEVSESGYSEVYNLEVEDTYSFSINGGLIVHNCMDALADTNVMYLHEFEDIKLPPWHNKMKGTYVSPAKVEENPDLLSWDKDYSDMEDADFWSEII